MRDSLLGRKDWFHNVSQCFTYKVLSKSHQKLKGEAASGPSDLEECVALASDSPDFER